jgi:biopolymer transport protein ExbD
MKLIRKEKSRDGLLITPLIDIIFLVVIFFMINASLSLNPDIEIDLPPAYTSQAVLEEEIIVTVDKDGTIFLGKKEVIIERFPAELKKEMAKLQRKRIFLQADEALPYRNLVEIMDIARLTGVESIGLVTSLKGLPR